MSRADDRAGLDLPGRVRLVESDLDKFDEAFLALRGELRALRAVLTGVLVAVTTATIMLAVNIAVRPGP